MSAHLRPEVARLFRALQEGDVEGLEELLASDRKLFTERDEVGRSLSLVAVYTGQIALAWDLIRRGAPEDLHEAAALGDLPRIRELLSKATVPAEAYAPDGWTPLHLAAFFGSAEACESLLDHGADISAVSRNPLANQPLHAAVAGGQAPVVRLLLSRHADVVSHRCQGGLTPLHLAAELGETEVVGLLLEAGAEVGVPNDLGQTPVDMARRSGHEDLVRVMLRHGARDLLVSRAHRVPG